MTPATDALFDAWYMAAPGRTLRPGTAVGKTLLGLPVLLGRAADGTAFALRDACPHRGIPLSHGRFDGREVECCFHGWRFDTCGTCTHIPSLLPDQAFDLCRVRTGQYPCKETQGNVWVYVPAPGTDAPAVLPDVPTVPAVDAGHHRLVERSLYECSMDAAVVGLVDPAHGPFVHGSWFWRSRRSLREKTKDYAPSPLGFTMTRHRPSSNSRLYKRLLGDDVTTEIRFELPGVRVEHIRAGRHHVCGLTTLTPLAPGLVEMHQTFYWTVPWLTLARPFLRPLVRRFIDQDRVVLGQQQGGLNDDPRLMLINDADRPARWYYQLKREWLASRAEGRPFANPVPATTLRWRT